MIFYVAFLYHGITRRYSWGSRRLVSTHSNCNPLGGGCPWTSSGQILIGGGGIIGQPRIRYSWQNEQNFAMPYSGSPCIADSLSHTTYLETNDSVFSLQQNLLQLIFVHRQGISVCYHKASVFAQLFRLPIGGERERNVHFIWNWLYLFSNNAYMTMWAWQTFTKSPEMPYFKRQKPYHFGSRLW